MFIVFWTCTYYLETMKQSRAAIADLTNDQGVCMVVQTHICHFEAGQCGDCGSVDYVEMGAWHRHVVTSILTKSFIGWH
jgi:UDP-2,3-diacylglucosamine pyrophosphatase LpxH